MVSISRLDMNERALTMRKDIGEVWANVLHNVYAALVEGFGWDADFKTNADSDKGNVVFMHLFIDSLALQPCNPTSELLPLPHTSKMADVRC